MHRRKSLKRNNSAILDLTRSAKVFSGTAWSLEVGGVTLPCLSKHVKRLVLRLITLYLWRITVLLDFLFIF